MGTVYLIRNTLNGKCYIGKTFHFKQRIARHFNGYGGAILLERSIAKHGKDNFSVEILHEGIIPDLLAGFEIASIKKYNTKSPYGFNLSDGGEGGVNPSEETLQKMSKAAVAREAKKKTDGYVVSDMTRQKISKATSQRDNSLVYTPAVRKVMSEKAKEREAKKKTDGCIILDKTRQKISKNSQKMWSKKRPPKHLAKEFYLSLPEDMPLSEKRKLVIEKFSHLVAYVENIRSWIVEWSGIKSESPKHPKHYEVRKLFFSLPLDMNLTIKRESCHTQFPDILRGTINRWIRKWQSEITY